MRTAFRSSCCACVAVAGSPSCADPRWAADARRRVAVALESVDARRYRSPSQRTRGNPRRWRLGDERAAPGSYFARRGGRRYRPSGTRIRPGLRLAVDPYDDSAWIGTDARLLLHFWNAGALAHGTSLPATASASFVALDQTPWLIAERRARSFFPAQASRCNSIHAPVAKDIVAGGLAVDSLREQAWIADSHAPCGAFDPAAVPDSTTAITTAARAIDARVRDRRSLGRRRADVDRHRS